MHIQAKKTVIDWSGCPIVEVVPGKVSGVPIIRGSRVPADQLVENYDAGESPEDIAYNFDLRSRGYSGCAGLCCRPSCRAPSVKVLFDQNVARNLARYLSAHKVTRSAELEWQQLKNGDLLDEAER